jgi:hypothetical protein
MFGFNLRMGAPSVVVYPAVQEFFELLTFRVFERDEVLSLRHRWLSSLASVDQTVPDSGIIHQIRYNGVLVRRMALCTKNIYNDLALVRA